MTSVWGPARQEAGKCRGKNAEGLSFFTKREICFLIFLECKGVFRGERGGCEGGGEGGNELLERGIRGCGRELCGTGRERDGVVAGGREF